MRLATCRGSLKNRERGERVTGADKLTKIPMVALFIAAGKGLNPRGSRRWGGEDVHRRPKGVGMLWFGRSEGVGRR
jgi:hypothetical protein